MTVQTTRMVPFEYQGILRKSREVRFLNVWLTEIRNEYKDNPELMNLIVDSYALNMRALMRIQRDRYSRNNKKKLLLKNEQAR